MKRRKLLFFATMLLPIASFGSGYTIANNWRWSKDNGALDTRADGDWLKPVNVAPVISTPQPLRLRILTFTTNDYTLTPSDRLILEYRVEPQSNSDVAQNTDAIKVNATSSTAGAWEQVALDDPATAAGAFVIDPNYDDTQAGALVDKSYGSTASYNLLYDNETLTNSPGPKALSRDSRLSSGDVTRRGGVGLSKTNELTSTVIPGGSTINKGGLEIEYRLVATKNATPGTTYYFRLRNARASGNGAGTTDHWDYSAGFPSIATSKDYNGVINTELPDLRAQFISGSGEYTTGNPRNGILRIANAGTVPSQGTITANIGVPLGWTFSIPTVPAGWSYTSGVLSSSSVTLAPGAGTNFSYTLRNSNAGFSTAVVQAIIAGTTIDGNGSNDLGIMQVYKKL